MVRPLRYLAAFVLFWLAAFVFPTSPGVARASGNTDPNAGPGGPILIITNASNPFTGYYAEILRNEGLNEFEVRDISSLTAQSLGAHDVAVLGETLTPLTAAQVDMLTQWTNAGGNLIAMRPDKQLYPLLGLTEAASTGASTLANGYLLFNPLKPATAGLVNQTIQFHGDADYTLLDATAGSTSVATLYSDATTATRYPAVTVRAVGTSGGQAAAFMFDLARSVVYTRQGNPAWSGLERDGSAPIRSNDLYSGDAQGDWIDFSKVAIPQADEQQRLLAHLVLHLNVSRRPLPRFWYLPRGLKAAVVMTGDDHANGGTIGRFDQYIGFSAPGCNVDNWECVRSTSYIYPNTPITDAQAKSYADQGFEIALHVDTGCADFTPTSLESFYADQLATFHGSFPTLSETATHRVHCVVWSDYDTQPQVELNHGIRLDTNYYYFFPAKGIGNRPGMFTGSGLPMRFATERGSLIDVYQAPTQMTDESGQTYPLTADTLLNNALGPQGYYGVFTANMHTDFNDVNAPKNSMVNSNAIIRSAQAHGVPVVSARQMLTWLDGRNNSSFAITSWDGSLLGFSITVAAGANGLQTMLPVRSGTLKLAGLTRGGAALDYTIATIKGVDYAFFPATTSAYAATYVTDTVSPIITGVNATATGPTSAVVTWTTDEKATSRIDLGTSVESLPSSVTDPSYVTSHSVSLTGLTPATRYYFRVTSGDGAIPSNVATSPAPPSTPASFTTLPPTFVDTTVGDFSRGTTDGSLYIAQTDDGEVILKPQVGNEFTSSTLPSDWFQQVWSPIAGATAEVSGGKLSVDGALVGQNALYGPGRSLEFVATFTDVFQHIGLGTDFNAAPWAMFSSDGQQVYARTNTSGDDGCPTAGPTCTPLGPGLLGSPHRFRIEWTAAGFVYSVDGVQVASHAASIAESMRPLAASDYTRGGGVLVNDWFRMSPYATRGVFLSQVFDATSPTNNWGTISWTAELPPGGAVSISVRTGNTHDPNDGTWTPFRLIPVSGGQAGGSSRYLQYRATLTTSDATRTPQLQDVRIQHNVDAATLPTDTLPPTIRDVTATVTDSASAVITWSTDEAATSKVQYTGNGAGTRTTSDSDLVTSHRIVLTGLTSQTTYSYTVSSTDFADNHATEGPLTFITPPARFVDTLASDFNQGQASSAVVTNIVDGEVTLGGTTLLDEDFGATSLPAPWSSGLWADEGAAVVRNGALVVDGAWAATGITAPCANTNCRSFGPGTSLEFVATFNATPYEHVGFVAGTDGSLGSQWAYFSTGASGDGVYARTSADPDILIPGALLGTPHRYRIDWTANGFIFWVDGVPSAYQPRTFTANMLAFASDFNPDGTKLTVDWLSVSSYAPSGTFTSRVFDAGHSVPWGTLSWSANAPATTGLAFSVSTGNVIPPDGSWTTTTVTANGGSIRQTSRYIQYRAALSTSDTGTAPVISDVTIAGSDSAAPVMPTLTWNTPADIPYGTALSTTQLNASAGSIAGTFHYTPDVGAVLNAGAAQTLSVSFTPDDTASYTTATKSVLINVTKATPTLTWNTPADIVYGTKLSATQLNASAGGIAGIFHYTPDVGTVLNAGAGQTLSVSFTPDDTANYATATKSVSINVTKVTPMITWNTPADIIYGTALSATQLNASAAGVAGTFHYTPDVGAVLNAGAAQALSVSFTPDDTANYATATTSVLINVTKATPMITWSNPADITYGTLLGTTNQLNATADVAGTFAYTPAAGTKLNAGNGQTLSVTFTPTDTTNYATAIKTVTIKVLKATPIITWSNPLDITYGTPLGSSQLNASASVPGTLTYTPAGGAVLNPGLAQTLSASFVPTDSVNYNTATKTVTINVRATTSTTLSSSATSFTYGQSVTLTSTVFNTAPSGGAPTGTVEFFDTGVSLGTVALSATGGASLTTTAIGAGTRSVTAVYHPSGLFATSTSPAVTMTVTKAAGTGTFATLSPTQQQYSDRVLLEATVSPATAANTVTFQSGTTVIAANVPVVNGKASVNAQMLIAPGTKIITAVFNSQNYAVANVSRSMSVTKEDARFFYTNPTTVCLCGAASVAITVNVDDITAVDSVSDANPGDIGTATVSFVNRTTGTTLATVSITPNADHKTGTATYNFPASSLGTANETTIKFGFVANGNYTRNSTTEDATIKITK